MVKERVNKWFPGINTYFVVILNILLSVFVHKE